MKNLINYLLLFIIITLTASCENDDSITEESLQKLIRVSEVTTSGSDIIADGFVDFEYNDNNLVSKEIASGGYTLDYIYNSNNQIIEVIYNNDNGDSYTIDFTYDNNLIVSEIYDNGNTTTYEYNSDDQLISLASNQGETLFLNYDNLGNVNEKIFDSEVIDSYQYDNMVNPTIFMYPEAYNKIKFKGPNNVTFREDGNRTTTYEYNTDDFPIASTHTLTGFVQNREYIYE
jgi:YD repeat-containing protein